MKKNILFVVLLITFGVLTRTIFHVGPNIEFVTSIGLISGYLFKEKRLALLVPLLIMLVSDSIIGNTKIFLFTWSAFLIPSLLGLLITKFKVDLKVKLGWFKLAFLTLNGSAISTMIFFIWTNFGHWLTTTMYSKDINGLTQSYINAIPFLRNQLAGNLLFAPMLMLVVVYFYSFYNLRKSDPKLNKAK